MTTMNNGGGSPAGATADHSDVSENNDTASARPAPVVFGVVELKLGDTQRRGMIPPGVRVRLNIGNAEPWEVTDLHHLASETWQARSVEVAGERAESLELAVATLRRAHREVAEREKNYAAGMAQWLPTPLGGAA